MHRGKEGNKNRQEIIRENNIKVYEGKIERERGNYIRTKEEMEKKGKQEGND